MKIRQNTEKKRILQLMEDAEHRPIIPIRFNPDDYIKKDGQLVTCWKKMNGKQE